MPAAPVAVAAAMALSDGASADDLPLEALEALLSELLASYQQKSFQEELARLRRASERAAVAGGGDVRGVLRSLALGVQAPVLQRHGLPGDARGVEIMKHMVQRRVAEGAGQLEKLANAARGALGLRPLPDRGEAAEQVLAERAEETERLVCASLPGAGLGPERQCLMRISVDRASGALPPASAALLEQLLRGGDVSVPTVLSLLNMAKVGIPAARLVDSGVALGWKVPVLEACTPEELFRSHVLPNRPVVIRSGTGSSSAYSQLLELAGSEYLKNRCGHRRVLVKSLSHEDRTGRPVFVTDPELRLPLAAFLEALEAHDRTGERIPFYLGKVPLRQELPELAEDIEAAESSPQRAYGSCFGSLVPQGVFTYFGCNRNTTPLHFDGYDNLMLCLCGGKRVLLYPPSDAPFLYPVGDGILHPPSDFSRAAAPPFAVPSQLPAEFRERFALLARARPLELTLEPGDLLYLPCCWWHCVEGSQGRNMILNWWFRLHPEKVALARQGAPSAVRGLGARQSST